MQIAKLLLLNYHPDVQRGREDILAIMFDMNALWERFVFRSLQRHLKGYTVRDQVSQLFWKPEKGVGYAVSIRPDIVIQKAGRRKAVLDTKWKLPQHNKPGNTDLFQLYAYAQQYGVEEVALVYPGHANPYHGRYEPVSPSENKRCSVVRLPVSDEMVSWPTDIAQAIEEWLKKSTESH